MDSDLRPFVDRCRAAASWRESIGSRHDDLRSIRSARALRELASGVGENSATAAEVSKRLAELNLDPSGAWPDAKEYAFTTYCLDDPESWQAWLERVSQSEH
jgi:hypothetical protein